MGPVNPKNLFPCPLSEANHNPRGKAPSTLTPQVCPVIDIPY